jgi:prevent-host-death family protein
LTNTEHFWYCRGMWNLYEAKTQLSALVDKAAAGQEIVIAKNGRPRAKLVPFREAVRRKPGRARGKIWIAADFDAPLPEALQDAFAGTASEAPLRTGEHAGTVRPPR